MMINESSVSWIILQNLLLYSVAKISSSLSTFVASHECCKSIAMLRIFPPSVSRSRNLPLKRSRHISPKSFIASAINCKQYSIEHQTHSSRIKQRLPLLRESWPISSKPSPASLQPCPKRLWPCLLPYRRTSTLG